MTISAVVKCNLQLLSGNCAAVVVNFEVREWKREKRGEQREMLRKRWVNVERNFRFCAVVNFPENMPWSYVTNIGFQQTNSTNHGHGQNALTMKWCWLLEDTEQNLKIHTGTKRVTRRRHRRQGTRVLKINRCLVSVELKRALYSVKDLGGSLTKASNEPTGTIFISHRLSESVQHDYVAISHSAVSEFLYTPI